MFNELKSKPNLWSDLCQVATSNLAYPFPQYAAWSLYHIANDHAKEFSQFAPIIVDGFLEINHQPVLRSLSVTLLKINMNHYREDELLNRLFEILSNPSNNLAILVNTIYLLIPFVNQFPELKNEVLSLIDLLQIRYKNPSLIVAKNKFLKKV